MPTVDNLTIVNNRHEPRVVIDQYGLHLFSDSIIAAQNPQTLQPTRYIFNFRLDSASKASYIFTIPGGTWVLGHVALICEDAAASGATVMIKACNLGTTIPLGIPQLLTPIDLGAPADTLRAVEFVGNVSGLNGLITVQIRGIEPGVSLHERK